MEIIEKYFPDITTVQRAQLARLQELYADWNGKVNVISRKDMDQLYLHHVLHSLAIARVCRFDDGARIADVGCGGGFPTIPLAIMFPGAKITAVDSIGKKITVVRSICRELELTNVQAINGRMESVDSKFDYIVSRAVTDMSTFVGWVWKKIEVGRHGTLPNGLLCLKGGDLTDELLAAGKRFKLYDVHDLFPEEYFLEKKVVYIQRQQ